MMTQYASSILLVMALQCLHYRTTYGFSSPSVDAVSVRLQRNIAFWKLSDTAKNGENEGGSESKPDLFEYFDPLLSPHAYPDGVSPDHKPNERPDTYSRQQKETKSSKSSASESSSDGGSSMKKDNFGFDFGLHDAVVQGSRSGTDDDAQTSSSPKTRNNNKTGVKEKEEDLFDYFDPLLSPHEYPDGIKSPKNSSGKEDKKEEEDDRYNPLRFKTLPVGTSSTLTSDPQSTATTSSSTAESTGKKKLGVLLIDHGSRNEASNVRLEKLAELYQLSMEYHDNDSSSSAVTVEAAHMEIVKPSIEDGLQSLLSQGVGALNYFFRICFALVAPLSLWPCSIDEIKLGVLSSLSSLPACCCFLMLPPSSHSFSSILSVLSGR